MSCQSEKCCCCCKIEDVTMLEKMLMGLSLAIDGNGVQRITLSDPISIRTFLLIKATEDRIMKQLHEMESKLWDIHADCM